MKTEAGQRNGSVDDGARNGAGAAVRRHGGARSAAARQARLDRSFLGAALAAGILIVSAGVLRAQTGVSGQPGVATTGMMTPMADASSSPAVVAPPPPNPYAPQRPTPARPAPPVAAPAPSAPSDPGDVRTAPAAAPPAEPPPAEPAEPAPARKGKREGADFYTPYLSASDVLDQTIVALTARVAARPGDAGLRNDLGNLLARRGFAREAIDQYRRAAKLDREFFLADYNEGLLLEKEGKRGQAISAYRRSIQRKPGFPLSRFHLGFLYEREGRASDAVAEYAKALRIDPSLRWPARNPLVVQTRLLFRASLANYERDLAAATLAGDGEFADRAVWERLQPQRPVNTSELEPEAEPEDAAPAVAASATGRPAGAPIIGGKPTAGSPAAGSGDPRRQQLIDQFRRTRPGRPAPSRTNIPVPPPPAPSVVEPPPEDENAPNPAMEEPPPP